MFPCTLIRRDESIGTLLTELWIINICYVFFI